MTSRIACTLPWGFDFVPLALLLFDLVEKSFPRTIDHQQTTVEVEWWLMNLGGNYGYYGH